MLSRDFYSSLTRTSLPVRLQQWLISLFEEDKRKFYHSNVGYMQKIRHRECLRQKADGNQARECTLHHLGWRLIQSVVLIWRCGVRLGRSHAKSRTIWRKHRTVSWRLRQVFPVIQDGSPFILSMHEANPLRFTGSLEHCKLHRIGDWEPCSVIERQMHRQFHFPNFSLLLLKATCTVTKTQTFSLLQIISKQMSPAFSEQ